VALLPAYAKTFLPQAVTTRPLQGQVPCIDLSLGYRKSNASPILKTLLSRTDQLVANVSKIVRHVAHASATPPPGGDEPRASPAAELPIAARPQ
jgi:hypothetical protein